MLPKSSRLNLGKDFKWVAAGFKRETQHLKFMYRFGDNVKPLVGIALSGQTFKKATERNRARRLTAFAIQKNYPILPKNLNLVIMPKRSILTLKSSSLEQELKNVTFASNSN